MTPLQAAEILGIDESHVRRLCRTGRIKHVARYSPGGRLHFYDIPLREVERLVNERHKPRSRRTLPGSGRRPYVG